MQVTERMTDIFTGPNEKIKRPNFFIVGAPKCGTTSMYYYLQNHPDIYMSVPKEPLYFGSDLENHRLKTRNRKEYLGFFAGSAGHKKVGEASTWYLYSHSAAREIKQFSPTAKIIIMLRKIPEAMYALHSQYLYTGNENVESFKQALELEAQRAKGDRLPPGTYFPDGLLYSQVYRYARQIKRYFREFGRENVLIIPLEEMKEDVSAVYRRVLNFLGLHEFPSTRFKRYNSNCRLKSDLLQELVQWVPGETKQQLREVLPVRSCMEAWRKLEPAMVNYFSRPPMSFELQKELLEITRSEVNTLEELLDRDFSHWLEGVEEKRI